MNNIDLPLNIVKGREHVAKPWIEHLSDEDLGFLKRFLLAGGTLKDLAAQYGISYPTVRLRLDRLIDKVKLSTPRLKPVRSSCGSVPRTPTVCSRRDVPRAPGSSSKGAGGST